MKNTNCSLLDVLVLCGLSLSVSLILSFSNIEKIELLENYHSNICHECGQIKN